MSNPFRAWNNILPNLPSAKKIQDGEDNLATAIYLSLLIYAGATVGFIALLSWLGTQSNSTLLSEGFAAPSTALPLLVAIFIGLVAQTQTRYKGQEKRIQDLVAKTEKLENITRSDFEKTFSATIFWVNAAHHTLLLFLFVLHLYTSMSTALIWLELYQNKPPEWMASIGFNASLMAALNILFVVYYRLDSLNEMNNKQLDDVYSKWRQIVVFEKVMSVTFQTEEGQTMKELIARYEIAMNDSRANFKTYFDETSHFHKLQSYFKALSKLLMTLFVPTALIYTILAFPFSIYINNNGNYLSTSFLTQSIYPFLLNLLVLLLIQIISIIVLLSIIYLLATKDKNPESSFLVWRWFARSLLVAILVIFFPLAGQEGLKILITFPGLLYCYVKIRCLMSEFLKKFQSHVRGIICQELSNDDHNTSRFTGGSICRQPSNRVSDGNMIKKWCSALLSSCHYLAQRAVYIKLSNMAGKEVY